MSKQFQDAQFFNTTASCVQYSYAWVGDDCFDFMLKKDFQNLARKKFCAYIFWSEITQYLINFELGSWFVEKNCQISVT